MKRWLFVALSLVSIAAAPGVRAADPKPAAPNTLTAAEKAKGWRLLFDGKTLNGWRGFKLQGLPSPTRWAAQNGELVRTAGKRTGDIVTVDEFDNFDLRWDWKISPGGNSGLKYLVQEAMSQHADDGVGLEYQMLDDEKHPDAKKGKDGDRTAGSLYDVIPPSKDRVLHPPGEWNESRVVVEGNHVEHWLNGIKIVSYERGSPEMKKRIAESKFKDIPGFGETSKGHILLQDHGNEVTLRNMKIRAGSKPVKTAKK
jgi:hypothetical protein